MNWRKIGFGSGALVAAISTAFAYSGADDRDSDIKDNSLDNHNQSKLVHHQYDYLSQMKSGFYVQTAGKNNKEEMLQDAIQKSRKLCKRVRTEMGLPGLAVGVSVNGKVVWQEGFGFANLENGVRMKPDSIMRIASISKSMTMAMLAKLMEEGKIDIDKPIQTYLPTYPEKCVDGEKVTITTRHLLTHLSGIRHYEKKDNGSKNENDPKDENVQDRKDSKAKRKQKATNEMDLSEYFLSKKFASVEESLKLFQDDELFHKPGTKYLYSTHGWTVVAAIIEKITETEFTKHCKRMFDYWGLKNTMLDVHETIIYNRASYYSRQKNGEIINSPYVDNSYKWAGGGFLSNVLDLIQFANILLYSMQTPEEQGQSESVLCEKGLPKTPFLKQSTIKEVWTGNSLTALPQIPDALYALGFKVGEPLRKCMFCKERDYKFVYHGGWAIGSSSILFLAFPPVHNANYCDKSKAQIEEKGRAEVNGVVVAMITNLTSVALVTAAQEIANYFKDLI